MFSQQLEDRGCCPLSCKQKGQSTVPSRQNKHTLLLGGQPQAACARWWPGQQLSAFPVTALSFLQKPAQECISGLLSKAPFHEFIDYTQTAFWYQDASTQVSGKRPHLRKPTLKCAPGKMSTDIIIFIKGYRFI